MRSTDRTKFSLQNSGRTYVYEMTGQVGPAKIIIVLKFNVIHVVKLTHY